MNEHRAKRILMMSSIFFVIIFLFVVLDNYRYDHIHITRNNIASAFIEQLVDKNVALEYSYNGNRVCEFINKDKEVMLISVNEDESIVTTVIPNNGKVYIFGEDNIITDISDIKVSPIMTELLVSNVQSTGYYKGLKGERVLIRLDNASYDIRMQKKSLLGKEGFVIVKTDANNQISSIVGIGYAYDWGLDKTFWYGEIADGESALGHIPYVIPKN